MEMANFDIISWDKQIWKTCLRNILDYNIFIKKYNYN